ncbi:MAG: ribonuclease R, partial [Kiritimatiellia bacterium]
MYVRFIGPVRDGAVRHPKLEGVSVPTTLPEGTWAKVELAKVTQFAAPNTALAEIVELTIERGHSVLLPDACEDEAAAWVANPGIDDPTLTDLTHTPFVTIDNRTSKDLDQAVFVERKGHNFIVWYALADAAYYVRPGSALLTEALTRGATYYLPGLTVPMLPLSLCEGLISINPHVDRRAMVFRMQVDKHGTCTQTDLIRARVHSVAKLSYPQVQGWYDGGDPPCDDAGALDSLECLKDVGERRMAEAESRHVIRFRRREVDIGVRGGGRRFVARTALRHDVERYGEQISLLTNIEGARLLRDGDAESDDIQPIYRTHQPPQRQRLRALRGQIDAIVRAHDLPNSWCWSGAKGQSLATYLRALPHGGEHGHVARAIQYGALFTGGRSGFSAEPAGHHGVGADVYARFTAPMREVVGCFVHKEAWEKTGRETPRPNTSDEALRDKVIDAAGRAKSEQRALTNASNRLVLDRMFERDLRTGAPPRAGVVMNIRKGRIQVELDDPSISVKVYTTHLQQQRGGALWVSKDGACLLDAKTSQPVLTLGDKVMIHVEGHDDQADRWRLGVT